MDLQEYEFELQHRPGTQNSNTDALSRLPQESSINTVLSNEVNQSPAHPAALACLTMLTPKKDLQQAQLEDLSIAKVIEIKTSGFPKPPYFVWAKNKHLSAFWSCWDNFFIVDGILVKSPKNPRNVLNYAVVVPEKLVHQVMSGLHCSSFGGHLGISKTISRAKNRFYWPQMRRCIRTFVQSCRVCGEIKISTSATKAPLMLVSHLFSGRWIIWGPYQKHLEVTNTYLWLWTILPNGARPFPTKPRKQERLPTF